MQESVRSSGTPRSMPRRITSDLSISENGASICRSCASPIASAPESAARNPGVASGNGKGQIFVKGQVIKTVPEADIVATLIEEANRIADEMGPSAPVGTAQVVTS